MDNGDKIRLPDILLDRCMQKIAEIRKKDVGFSFVTLSSTKAGYHLYLRNGFERLDEDMNFSIEESEDGCIPMYYAIDVE